MSEPVQTDWNDDRVNHLVGRVLRVGVLLAALLVLVGAAIYLPKHGAELADYAVFNKAATGILDPAGLLAGLLAFNGVALIELGLLVLIATPITSVLLSGYGFYRQHDVLYVVVSAIVFAILLFSLFVVR